MRLYDDQGHQFFLTGSEREAFRKAAEAHHARAPMDLEPENRLYPRD